MRKLLCFFGIHRYVDEGITCYFMGGEVTKLSEGRISRCVYCSRAKYQFIRALGSDQLTSL